MAPIYESDVAEKRWSESEWNHYEFWEKVENRLRRNKRFWIALTFLLFLGVSSIPVVLEQRPHWRAQLLSRLLAREINSLKREASLQHLAYRIRFAGNGSLDYVIERSESCQSAVAVKVRDSSLLPGVKEDGLGTFVLLAGDQGERMGLGGLVTDFCYDPLQGSEPFRQGIAHVGFVIAPANDLTTGRVDRLAVLVLSGASAETVFD